MGSRSKKLVKKVGFVKKYWIKPGIYLKYTPFINICYTDIMPKDRTFWSGWASFLQQWGLTDIAAAWLETAGPLSIFLATVVYAGRPFLGQLFPDERLLALAEMFEDQEESRSFAAFIREESSG
jgi:hypothetical protein